jgi:magnesium transporter
VAYYGGTRVRDVALEETGEILEENDSFVWIGLHEPDEALQRQVAGRIRSSRSRHRGAHRAHQRPKLGEVTQRIQRAERTDAHAKACGHLFYGFRQAGSL